MTVNPMTYMVDGLRHAMHGGAAPVAEVSFSTSLLVLVLLALGTQALAVWTASRTGRWRP